MVKIQIPWRLRKLSSNVKSVTAYAANRLRHALARSQGSGGQRIEFNIPFYGYTGGSNAIVNIANSLASEFQVSFFTHPANVLNAYVSGKVRLVTHPSDDAALYVVESGTEITLLREAVGRGAKVLISSHGFPAVSEMSNKNYGYSDSQIADAMTVATAGHFLSKAQIDAFAQTGIPVPGHVLLIPNAVGQVRKSGRTRSAGLVGDTVLPLKNAARAVQAAENSNAEFVHVWGRYSSRYDSRRAIWHGFERDKVLIFNSFDVLVSLSFNETQPLIVLEAMSAGVPCVLSDLPCYEEFKGEAGFWFVDPNDVDGATRAINAALSVDEATRESLKRRWRESFSPSVIDELWHRQVRGLLAQDELAGPV